MTITESYIAQAIQYAKEGNPNDMKHCLIRLLTPLT
jgi:hypothetical protein